MVDVASPSAANRVIPPGAVEAFASFEAEARALPPESLKTPRVRALVIAANADASYAAIFAEEARVKAELPTVDWARLVQRKALVLAYVYASALADTSPPKVVKALAKQVGELRSFFSVTAKSLVKAGLLPKAAVNEIEKGTNKGAEAAEDTLRWADLFGRFMTELEGRSPVTREHIQQAGELATKLLPLLRVRGVDTSTPNEATVVRDQFYTLLVAEHDLLLRIGGWLWGADRDAHVRPLGAARYASKDKQPTAG